SRIARLAGHGVRAERLGHQADAALDRHLGDLPPGLAGQRRADPPRPVQPPAGARAAAAAVGRGHPRPGPVRGRPPEPAAVRPGSAAQKVQYAFRLCLTRSPQPAEERRLVELYERARKQLALTPQKAADLATNPLGAAPAGTDPVELAAWTVVGNVLLNLDETL